MHKTTPLNLKHMCQMERAVFAKLMRIGLAAMKCCFAEKGTGDAGNELQLQNGKILKKETRLHGRDYLIKPDDTTIWFGQIPVALVAGKTRAYQIERIDNCYHFRSIRPNTRVHFFVTPQDRRYCSPHYYLAGVAQHFRKIEP